MEYLIDTDIMIDFLKKKYHLDQKIKSVGAENCYVSEITIAELLFGAEKSDNLKKQFANVDKVKRIFKVLPISDILELYANERLYLERKGTRIPNFDLLIGVTAVHYQMTMVTGNTKHLARIRNIKIENWREKQFNEFIQ